MRRIINNHVDFNSVCGKPKASKTKLWHKTDIFVHPEFLGIYYCYFEIFKALKVDLSLLNFSSELNVFEDPHSNCYYITNLFHWYLYYKSNPPKYINLRIYDYPDNNLINELKKLISHEFIQFISSFQFDIDLINPNRLHNLINTHISPELILELNKRHSFKPHSKMSMDLLAKKLSFNRNQLNYRIHILSQERNNVLIELEQSSPLIYQLLNDLNFELNAEQLWSLK